MRVGLRGTVFLLMGLTTSACEPVPGSEPARGAALLKSTADSVWAVADTLIAGGSESPRVLIFGDLQCPSCAALLAEMLAPDGERQTGDLTLGFIHTPLPPHIRSPVAAAPIGCLPDAGARADYLNEVIDGRPQWISGPPVAPFVDSLLLASGFPECGPGPDPGAVEETARQLAQRDWARKLLVAWSPTILVGDVWLPREASSMSGVRAMLRVEAARTAGSTPD